MELTGLVSFSFSAAHTDSELRRHPPTPGKAGSLFPTWHSLGRRGQGILNSTAFVLLWGQMHATNPFCGKTCFWKPQTLIKARLIVKKQSSSIGKTGKGVSKHKQA